MFFSLIKEINRLRKEINKLLSKGMWNSYLKVTIEKNRRSQNFNFLSLKNLSPGQFLESSNSRRYRRILKLLKLWRFKVKESNHFTDEKYKLS